MPPSRENTVFLLPGMGADSSMYCGPWRDLDFLRFANWPEWRGETTLDAVAGRIVAANEIRPGDIVGGSSLGGMVALEIARQIPVRAVVLIGSAAEGHEINSFLRLVAPLASLTPIRFGQILAGISADPRIGESFSRADSAFIRSMCRALASWPGGIAPGAAYSVLRIHGARDLVIPCPRRDAARVVPGAGHLVAITHPAECVEWITGIYANLTQQAGT